MGIFHWDWTINVTNILICGGTLVAFFRGFLAVRDAIRDLTKTVGEVGPPPTGMIREIEHIRVEQADHRDWLIAAGLDRRGYDRRTQ